MKKLVYFMTRTGIIVDTYHGDKYGWDDAYSIYTPKGKILLHNINKKQAKLLLKHLNK